MSNPNSQKDVLTLCLRLCLEPSDSHSPDTLDVLDRYRPAWEAAAGGMDPDQALALLPKQDGPSEREAAIDECRDAAHDAIHHAIERMDLCAFVKGHVDEALLALKNAAPQERSQPVGKGAEATVEGPDHPARASSEAGADDAALLDWAETHPEEAMRLLTTWWATAGRGCRERRFEFRNIFRSGQSATPDDGK